MCRTSREWRLACCVFSLLASVTKLAIGQELSVSGGLTAVAIETVDSPINSDQTLSVDLNIERTTASGSWFAYIEGNSSLARQGASTVLVEANADAGTALDPERNGRVQLSEFNYRWDRGDDRLTIGLIDASNYLDRSRITNDENVQFLGASFVNNPTIEFPDYALGVALERSGRGRRPVINAVISSSHGIADNPNLSYSQLIQVSRDDKGVFGAVGAGWVRDRTSIRVGGWFNTSDHESLAGGDLNASNYGLYAVMGISRNQHGANLRIGLANDEITEAATFIAVAYRIRIGEHGLGFGAAKAFHSRQAQDPALDDSLQLEAFARFQLGAASHITLSVQRLHNSGFHSLRTDPRHSVSLVALRLHHSFGQTS